MRKPVKVGDRVAYRADWLRASGLYLYAVASARGTVEKLEAGFGPPPGLATVKWDDPETPARVLACNLVRVDARRGLPAE